MRKLLILAMFYTAAFAENSVTIHIGTQTWKFVIPVTVSGLTCDKTSLSKGESSACTLTLDSPAPAGGFVVTPYTADAPAILSPASMTVPAGSMTIGFSVTIPAS